VKVLVTGAGGQLGQTIARRFQLHHDVIACDRAALDITSHAAVHEVIHAARPEVIVNCAADNDVDGSEDHPTRALAVNAWAVRLLARAAREIDATLVHYSTDFIFDGTATSPYDEEATPNPRGAYATSKLIGEWFAAEVPRHYVLRVESLFGGRRARSSVDHLLTRVLNGREVRVFVDRTVSPSHVDDVARATEAIIERRPPYGLYHCVNRGWTDWQTLTRELAARAGRPDATIVRVRLADAGLRAPRPQFAALSNEKLTRVGIPMPPWQDAIGRYVAAVMKSAPAIGPLKEE
jgi:dTDP-4-dehydrorhamnose reductase